MNKTTLIYLAVGVAIGYLATDTLATKPLFSQAYDFGHNFGNKSAA